MRQATEAHEIQESDSGFMLDSYEDYFRDTCSICGEVLDTEEMVNDTGMCNPCWHEAEIDVTDEFLSDCEEMSLDEIYDTDYDSVWE